MKKASLTLDKDFTVGEVDDRIYGSFVEHIGRVIYGGVYEPEGKYSDEEGFRTDVIELVKELDVPVVRYPGGNFVSGYCWKDGVGPDRPVRLDLAWRSLEPNTFGLNEFMRWTKKADTEAMMCVNLGTRGADEARELVEYCNFPGGTRLSDTRRAHGREDPYGIKLWCLGNEMDGEWQIGHKKAHEYGRLACESAKQMRWTDPSIELVVCGSSNRDMATYPEWERIVLENTYQYVDYISLHQYLANRDMDFASFVARPMLMDDYINSVIAACDYVKAKKRSKKTINISFDEWNMMYHTTMDPTSFDILNPSLSNIFGAWKTGAKILEDVYNFADALAAGGFLITFLRHADRVKIACQAQLVNALGAIMTDRDARAWRQTIFYPYLHASKYGRGVSLQTVLLSPEYDCRQFGSAPCLDCAAVDNAGAPEGEQLTVFVVNRDAENDILFEMRIKGYEDYALHEHICMNGYPAQTRNTIEEPLAVTPKLLEFDANVSEIMLPKFSWNVIRFKKSKRA